MTLRQLLEAAPEVRPEDTWPEPLPLYRPLEEAPPYPLGALGPLEGVVREVIRIVQAPDAVVAGSFLGAVALGGQGLVDVEVDGRVHPTSLFLLSIAESGERKTTADEVALRPVREWQRALYLRQEAFLAEWEGRFEAWQAEKHRILRDKKRTLKEKEQALDELGLPPPKPWRGVVLTTEPTFEGLAHLLADGWPAVGLFASEGGAFLGGHAMSQDHRLRTLAGLSALWDGQPLDRVRVGEGVRVLFGRRLSLHLLVQPLVSRALLGDLLAREQGFLSRALVAQPPGRAGGRTYVAEDPCATPAYRAYAHRLEGLLEALEGAVLGQDGVRGEGLQPRRVGLTPEAKRTWVRFYEATEAHLRGDLAPVRGLAAKAPEHALRLAGVLATFRDPEVATLDEEVVGMGIVLAQYYVGEALRLEEAFHIPRELRLAEEVLGWLLKYLAKRERRVFTTSELYRNGPREVRKVEDAQRALRTLERHHYVRFVGEGEVDGKPSHEVWEVSPHVFPLV